MSLRLAALLLFAASHCLGQIAPSLQKDPQAVTIAQHVVAAGGGPLMAGDGTHAVGSIRFGSGTNEFPISIYTLGNSRVRTEIVRPEGMDVKLQNDGIGAFTSATRRMHRLSTNGTLAERCSHIPAASLIADYLDPNVSLVYLGRDTSSAASTSRVAASWSDSTDADEQHHLLVLTRLTYLIDAQTFDVLETSYDKASESDSNVIIHYRVTFQKYKQFDRRRVPSLITTYANGKTASVLAIASFEAVSLNPDQFIVPKDAK